jgi:hypothetical protein
MTAQASTHDRLIMDRCGGAAGVDTMTDSTAMRVTLTKGKIARFCRAERRVEQGHAEQSGAASREDHELW